MKQYFSEKIKTLRRNADLTQEKLAEYLGVAAQTVSKWERAETYPDIDLLPMIANYFHITIDELLGHDIMRADLEIDQLIAQSRELARLGHEEEAIALSLSGYQKYPYSHKMMARYAKDLLLYSEGEAWKKALPVAEKIAETILEDSSDENLRYDALDMLGSVYFDTPKKYEALCERIPEGFTFTREMWIAEGHPIDTDQGLALRQKNMLKLMHLFFSQVDTLCGIRCNPQPKKLPDADTSIAVRKMKLNILQCIFSEGDFVEYAWNMAWNSYHLFVLLYKTGDRAQALEYLQSAAKYSVAYETRPAYARRTSFLVSHTVYDRNKETVPGMCGSAEYYLEQLRDPIYDDLRDEPIYQSAIKMLSDCPKRS